MKSESSDEYLAGFQLARQYPNHNMIYLTTLEDDALFMLFEGNQPSPEDVLEALSRDQSVKQFYEAYRQDIEDAINEEVDDMLHNH